MLHASSSWSSPESSAVNRHFTPSLESSHREFSRDLLDIDPVRETERIVEFLREQLAVHLKRNGVVLGLSGNLESSVTATLAVRALGNKRVLGLLMPDLETSPEQDLQARELAQQLGIASPLEDISPILSGAGCYLRRDQALRAVYPDFRSGDQLLFPATRHITANNIDHLEFVVRKSDGSTLPLQLSWTAYETLQAATHFKQRARKMIEYFYADQLHYAVIGCSNLLEYDQGFFVKNGDGAADVKPLAHLYPSQVRTLADYLDIPSTIRQSPASGQTFSLQSSSFTLSEQDLDLCLFAMNHDISSAQLAAAIACPLEQVELVLREMHASRAAAAYLHAGPMLVSPC